MLEKLEEDSAAVITAKVEFNTSRPYKHGKGY
jgi:hypothetical protein